MNNSELSDVERSVLAALCVGGRGQRVREARMRTRTSSAPIATLQISIDVWARYTPKKPDGELLEAPEAHVFLLASLEREPASRRELIFVRDERSACDPFTSSFFTDRRQIVDTLFDRAPTNQPEHLAGVHRAVQREEETTTAT